MFADFRTVLDAVTWDGLAWLLLRITLLLALGHVALALLASRATAATRHLVALATLGAAATLPIASALPPVAPALVVPVEMTETAPALFALVPPVVTPAPRIARTPEPTALPKVFKVWTVTPEPTPATPAIPVPARSKTVTPAPSTPDFEWTPEAWQVVVADSPVSPWMSFTTRVRDALPSWAVLIALLAAAVAAALIARVALGLFVTRRVFLAAPPAGEPDLGDVLAVARDARGAPIPVAISDRVSVPVVVGVLRPSVLLPAAARDWSRERLRAVMLHEVGHIHRRDPLALLLGRVATAALWFHPLAWTLARAARGECERACDDVVLASGLRASDYADHLLAIAHAATSRGRVPGVSLAFARRVGLEDRLVALLDAGVARGPAGRGTVAAIACVAGLLLLPLASFRVVTACEEKPEAVEAAAESWDAEETPAPKPRDPRAAAYVDRVRAKVMEAAERILSKNPPIDGEHVSIEDALAEPDVRTPEAPEVPEAPETPESPEPVVAPEAVQLVITAQEIAAARAAAEAYAAQVQAEAAGSKKHDHDEAVGAQIYARALELYQAKQFARAGEAFSRAAPYDDGGTAWYNAACSFARAGMHEKAMAALIEGYDDGFTRMDLLQGDSDLNSLRGDARFKALIQKARSSGDFQDARAEAISEYESLRESDSDEPGEWQSAGTKLLRAAEPRRSAEAFERQYRIDSSPNALYNRACAEAVGGKHGEAIATLERAILEGAGSGEQLAEDPDFESLRGDGAFERLEALASDLTLEKNGLHLEKWHGSEDQTDEWREELPRLERATRKHPEIGRAWSNLGIGQLRARKYQESIASLHHALELGYRKPQTMYNIACSEAQAGDLDAAMQWLRRAEGAGMEVFGRAPHDEDLVPLHDDARFRQMERAWKVKHEQEAKYKHKYEWKEKSQKSGRLKKT